MAEELELSLKVDDQGSEKVEDVNKKIDQTTQSTSELSEEMGLADTAVGKMFTSIKKGVRIGVASFKTLKGAIAATGIGLLITAIASLTAYFTQTERGAQKLREVMAGVKAVIGVVTDVFINLGENLTKIPNMIKGLVGQFDSFGDALKSLGKLLLDNIINRFKAFGVLGKSIVKILKGDFKEGFKGLADGAVQFGTGITDATDKAKKGFDKAAKAVREKKEEIDKVVQAAVELEKAQNNLNVREREALVLDEQRKREALKNQEIAKDATKSLEERIAALNKQEALEKEMMNDKIARAKEQARIIEQQNKLSESSEEDLQKQAEAEAEVERLMTEQQQLFNTLHAERSALIAQEAAQKEAERQKELERTRSFNEEMRELEEENYLAGLETDEERRLAELELERERFNRDLQTRLENEELTEKQANQLKNEYNQKYLRDKKKVEQEQAKAAEERAQKEVEIERQKNEQKKESNYETANSFIEAGERIFGESKALATAQVYIDILKGVQAAFNSQAGIPVVGPVLAAAQATAALVSGMARLNKIHSTNKEKTPKFARGGRIRGKLHREGGTKIEAEGGEFVVNRRAMSNPKIARQVQQLNDMGNNTTSHSPSKDQDDLANKIIAGIRGINVSVSENSIRETTKRVNVREKKFTVS